MKTVLTTEFSSMGPHMTEQEVMHVTYQGDEPN